MYKNHQLWENIGSSVKNKDMDAMLPLCLELQSYPWKAMMMAACYPPQWQEARLECE
jgi:hypothetical protein